MQNKNWHKPSAAILMACTAMLAGCVSIVEEDVVESVDKAKRQLAPSVAPLSTQGNIKGTSPNADMRAAQQKKPWVAKRATRPWHGSQMVTVQSDEQLPPVFYEPYDFTFDDRAKGGVVSLDLVVERISKLTSVPIRIKSDVYSAAQPRPATGNPVAAGAAPASSVIQVPIPGSLANGPGAGQPGNTVPVGAVATADAFAQASPLSPIGLNAVDMRWQGKDLSSFLNYVTDRLGLSWSYRDGVVYIERFITETFEMGVFQSAQRFSMQLSGTSSGNGSGGGSSSNLDVQEAGAVDVVKGLIDSVKSMVSSVSGATVSISEGSGTILVTAPKDLMSRVRALIKAEQESYSRQVLIQIDVYSITSTKNSERGFNYAAAFRNLVNTLNLTVATPPTLTSANAASIGILATGTPANTVAGGIFDTTSVINALSQNGVSVQHRPLSMIAMNRQWARKTSLRQKGYLSETTPAVASAAGSGTPGLKTSTVTTGDRFVVMPAILDGGQILLKFGVSLTDLLGLFDVTTGSGQTLQKVQTPEISGTDDQSSVRLRAGEVMMLTGVSRMRSVNDNRRLTDDAPLAAGGSSTASVVREDFVIFVRPVIL